MTNKNYANKLIRLFNSANEEFKHFVGFEEPIVEIERENCNVEKIQTELSKLGYKTEIRISKKLKDKVLYITKD